MARLHLGRASFEALSTVLRTALLAPQDDGMATAKILDCFAALAMTLLKQLCTQHANSCADALNAFAQPS